MAKSNKFGTFGGVFTPSILTILGVIMYLRLPMIVGEAGLYATIGIILIAHLISITTGLSVSSIATDKKVEAGGTYYMISRSLGLPIGGTLGIALFVGLSFSVSLYLIGFSESFLGYWGFEHTIENIRIAGSIVLFLVTVLTFISTSLAIKTQYFIMAAIGLSLLSIFFGNHDHAPAAISVVSTNTTIPLMVLFGIFFPAVTGFEAGVSMSGDLKDSKKSIPFGAISAIAVGLVVYIGLAFYFTYTVDRNILATDPNVLLKISWIPELVIAGIWGATLSSALGSILGAPRILQATAKDKITPSIFAKGTRKANEPRNALLLTFVIAEAGILIGDLDVIARIVSIFFILTYGFLNISCAFERLTSADFRPEFKTPAWVSIIGAAACIIVMIQLDFAALLIGVVILSAIYSFIKRKELELETGDAWSSIWSSLVRLGLKNLHVNNLKTRNWRPNIIMFSGDENSRPSMIQIGKDIAGKLGILTGFELVESDSDLIERKTTQNSKEKVTYFYNKLMCKDVFTGMDEVVRVYGFNGIEPNTVLMGWSNDKSKRNEFVNFIASLEKNNFNSIFLKYDTQKSFGNYKTIDIWWSGWGSNLAFSINLIRHLTSTVSWNQSKLRLFVITDDSSMVEIIYNSIRSVLDDYRVSMEIKVVNNSLERLDKNTLIIQNSQNSDLTIIGIPDKKYHKINETYDEVSKLSMQMGTMLLINSSKDFDEFNIIENNHKLIDNRLLEKVNQEFAPLIYTNYPLLNKELEQYYIKGIERESEFYEKAFATYFIEQADLVAQMKSLPIITFGGIIKLIDDKIDNNCVSTVYEMLDELYVFSEEKLKNFLNERLALQVSVLTAGIEWYNKQLQSDFANTPLKINIKYDRSEFNVQAADVASLKAYKKKVLILHPFSRKTIDQVIHFRKIARLYLVQSRQQHLQSLLKEINVSGIQFLLDLRAWIFSLNNELSTICAEIEAGNVDKVILTAKQSELIEKISRIEELVESQRLGFKNKILVEFRYNIQLLSKDLNKVNVNKLIDKKKRKDRYYNDLMQTNLAFPLKWQEEYSPIVAKLVLDLQILKLKNICSKEIYKLTTNSKSLIETELRSKVIVIEKIISKFKPNQEFLFPTFKIKDGYFNFDEFLEQLRTEINKEIVKLPVEQAVYSDPLMRSNAFDLSNNELLTVPVQKMVQHFVDSKLIGNVLEELTLLDSELNKLNYRVNDQIIYMNFEFSNIDLEKNAEGIEQLLFDGKAIFDKTVFDIDDLNVRFDVNAYKSIENTFELLMSHKIVESTKSLAQILRNFKNHKHLSKLQKLINSIQLTLRNLTVKVLYSQSEGVLLARKLQQRDDINSISEKYLSFVDVVSPNQQVFRDIPMYYKNLFSGHSSIGDDFWIERKVVEAHFEKAINHYSAGYRGGIFVIGERNSGKTALCQYVARHQLKNQTVYHIYPPLQGSISVKDFEIELNTVTKIDGNVITILEKLPFNSVLIFHDLELWWESTEKGMKIIELIQELIKRYSDKCLIIANMNSISYQFIDRIKNITNSLIAVIQCNPFDSEELKELVLKRHRSRDMRFVLNSKHENDLSEIRLASLFNRFFNYSNGNPGATLLAWIASVNSFENAQLYLSPINKPNTVIFEFLPDDWKVILYQFYLHKRMTSSKLVNVLMLDESHIMNIIDMLVRSGLITEKSTGVYIINPYVDNFLLDYLVERK